MTTSTTRRGHSTAVDVSASHRGAPVQSEFRSLGDSRSANLATSRGPFLQAVSAILVILFWIAFMLLSAGSILAAIFILLFVKT